MPYFRNEDINLLFIHIPKTGGTSVETYFSVKFGIPLRKSSLFTPNKGSQLSYSNGISYQHQTLRTLMTNAHKFGIEQNDLELLSIVRNPYDRIVSDLFFYNLISTNSSQVEVADVVEMYLSSSSDHRDNHRLPQYAFLVGGAEGSSSSDGQLAPGIKLLRTERLNDMMHDLGYTDFDVHLNKRKKQARSSLSYFNDKSLHLINTYYAKDFRLFGYEMILPSHQPQLKTLPWIEGEIDNQPPFKRVAQSVFIRGQQLPQHPNIKKSLGVMLPIPSLPPPDLQQKVLPPPGSALHQSAAQPYLRKRVQLTAPKNATAVLNKSNKTKTFAELVNEDCSAMPSESSRLPPTTTVVCPGRSSLDSILASHVQQQQQQKKK